MSTVLTPEDVKKYEEERILEAESQPTSTMEYTKMFATLALNIAVIVILVLAAYSTTGDLSSRFTSLLEVVIGAIFGVTATQVTKG
jgi:F0F1-type ATP synthase membrane subunit a